MQTQTRRHQRRVVTGEVGGNERGEHDCGVPDFYFYVTTTSRNPVAEFDGPSLILRPRKWNVSIFDWTYLAVTPPHRLNVEYQLIDVLTKTCDVSIGLRDAADHSEAKRKFSALRAMSCALGVEPLIAQFVGTHPLDALSAINGAPADSEDPRHATAATVRSGEDPVEVWWNQPTLGLLPSGTRVFLDSESAQAAAELLQAWVDICDQMPRLRVLEEVLVSAPVSTSYPQATMSVWGALESLFPSVQTEVTYRVAMYLTQLVRPPDPLAYLKSVRSAYAQRSRIAHGSVSSARDEIAAWQGAWALLCDATLAITRRGVLPTEEDLTREMLTRP